MAPRARILFVDHPPSFDRAGLYGLGSADYPDNALRFALLSQAALGFAARHGRPSVVHAHDWQTGLAPLYLARPERGLAPLAGVPAVFTIHNLAFQGLFPAETLASVGVDRHLFTVDGVEYRGQLSFLKAGINFSDAVTTVSPRYAQEILTPELGFGFDGVLSARRDRLVGILNGIDHDVWDPARDALLPARYSARDLVRASAPARRALLETVGLPAGDDALARPLVGMVGRLTDQKGLDLRGARRRGARGARRDLRGRRHGRVALRGDVDAAGRAPAGSRRRRRSASTSGWPTWSKRARTCSSCPRGSSRAA